MEQLTNLSLTQKQQLPGKLLLLETQLAGFQFYEGRQVVEQLASNNKLILKRDTENKVDINAVEVYWKQHKLGFIPATDNVVIGQMMDRGEQLTAYTLQLKNSFNPWNCVGVGVGVYWEGSL